MLCVSYELFGTAATAADKNILSTTYIAPACDEWPWILKALENMFWAYEYVQIPVYITITY